MKKLLLIVFILLATTTFLNAQERVGFDFNEQVPVLRFYPNPAINTINFDFQKSYEKGYSLHIFNLLGRRMKELPNISDRTTIDLSDFTRGVYIYQLYDKSGNLIESGKFQVSK